MKSRKQKEKIYNEKYKDIPRNFQERLDWMYSHYHLTDFKCDEIIRIREQMLQSFKFSPELFIVLYEEPEGAPRPRARFMGNNLSSIAKSNPGYIQIYSLTGEADRKYMKRLVTDSEFNQLDSLICTPCSVRYEAYFKTPSNFNTMDKYLAEIGIIRPITKPDFDNIEKKYSDMYNGNIWLDDALVIESSFAKFYSILPRVEISLKYLNLLYNKQQYESVIKRVENSNVNYFRKE